MQQIFDASKFACYKIIFLDAFINNYDLFYDYLMYLDLLLPPQSA